MPITAAAVHRDHRERRQAGPDRLPARPPSTPAITEAALLPLPRRAITGRSGRVWPGGRAIAQFVGYPRARRRSTFR